MGAGSVKPRYAAYFAIMEYDGVSSNVRIPLFRARRRFSAILGEFTYEDVYSG